MAYVKMYDVAESARYIASRMVQRPVKTIDMLNIIVCAKAVVATHKPPPRPFK
jgi:vacuolar-type H+-ATPase subunit B/Vma2